MMFVLIWLLMVIWLQWYVRQADVRAWVVASVVGSWLLFCVIFC